MINGANVAEPQPVQPDPQYVVAILSQELRALQENKLYLLAIMAQMQAEFAEAHELWELERASLKAGKSEE